MAWIGEALCPTDKGSLSIYSLGYPDYRNYFDPKSEENVISLLERAGSFGGKISLLNELIWLHFRKAPEYVKMTVLNAPDPLKEYIETAKETVEEKPLLDAGLYIVNGVFIEDTAHTIFDVFDSISQHQYLGLFEYFIENYKNDGFDFFENRKEGP